MIEARSLWAPALLVRFLPGQALLLGRCLLIGILIAALGGLHVLSAEAGPHPSVATFVTDTAGVAVTSSAVAPGPGTGSGALLQCNGAGDCVLFPAAGPAIVVLLLAGATARALRRHHHIAQRWTRAAASIASRRGPPSSRRRPRIALCVIRV